MNEQEMRDQANREAGLLVDPEIFAIRQLKEQEQLRRDQERADVGLYYNNLFNKMQYAVGEEERTLGAARQKAQYGYEDANKNITQRSNQMMQQGQSNLRRRGVAVANGGAYADLLNRVGEATMQEVGTNERNWAGTQADFAMRGENVRSKYLMDQTQYESEKANRLTDIIDALNLFLSQKDAALQEQERKRGEYASSAYAKLLQAELDRAAAMSRGGGGGGGGDNSELDNEYGYYIGARGLFASNADYLAQMAANVGAGTMSPEAYNAVLNASAGMPDTPGQAWAKNKMQYVRNVHS